MVEIDGVQYLNTAEAAERLNVSLKTVRNLAYTGKLHALHRTGYRQSLFPVSEVEALAALKPGKGSRAHPKPSKP